MTIFHSQIILEQKTIPYSVRFSSRARRYRIVISQSGVELVLPEGTPISKAPGFLSAHADWILQHIMRLEKLKSKYRQEHLPAGIVLMEGIPYSVHVSASGQSNAKIQIDKDARKLNLQVPLKQKRSSLLLMEQLLQKQARIVLKKIVRQRAASMRVHPSQITIRDQRTRWGSCSSKGTISLNWRLIMAPPAVLDYVIVHELCHLVEHNHSRRFWQLVEVNCPDFQRMKQWLKINSTSLHPVL